MIGNWKWNLCAALAAMGLTFAASLANNPLSTSLLRGVYAFAILFLTVYAVRFLWGTFAGFAPEERAGSAVDMQTPPDHEAILRELREQPADGAKPGDEFVPLQPKKLVTADKIDSQLLAQSLRQMSDE